VSRALDRAGFKVIAGGLQQCLDSDDAEERAASVAQMEKLFLSLA
jgi:DNA-binding FrmR family transcriptional regulator